MPLLDNMSEGNSFKKISVDQIRPNRMNFYAHLNDEDEEIYVNDMAEQLLDYGQDSNGVVYLDTSIDDGKMYTLLAGERRWKAIKKNFEENKGDGLFMVKIVPKPESETDEKIHLIMNNAQRNKTKEVKKTEVEVLSECWNELVEQGKKPKGRKREWIAKGMGMSPRQVQEYLTGSLADDENEGEVEIDVGGLQLGEDETNEQTMTSADEETLKMIEKNLRESTGRKVKISKKCAITFYAQNDDMEDMYTILNDLGFTEEGIFK